MSLKIKVEIITKDIETTEVFCYYCNAHIGNMDENESIYRTHNSSAVGEVKLLINKTWYYISEDICEECAKQKMESIVSFCNSIGLK